MGKSHDRPGKEKKKPKADKNKKDKGAATAGGMGKPGFGKK